MKIKSLYIYLGVFVIALVSLAIFYSSDETKVITKIDQNNTEMPNDDIHKGMQGAGESAPSSGNVSSDFKQKMDELANYVTENSNDTAKVKEYAELLSAAHNPNKAIELYESILVKDNSRIDILMPLVYLYYSNKNLEKAEEYTNRVLKINPKQSQAVYNIGAIEASKGNMEKAKEIWRGILKDFPNSEAAHIAEQSLKQL